MRKMVEKLLWQHGIRIRVEERTVRALFQPVTGKLERLAQREPGILGLERAMRWIYIGPVEPEPKRRTYALRSLLGDADQNWP